MDYWGAPGLRNLSEPSPASVKGGDIELRKLIKAEGEPSIPMRSCVASYHGILSWCDGTRLHRMYVDPVLNKWRQNYAEVCIEK